MKTKVYVCKTIENAELLFREFVNRSGYGGNHKYRWTGYMGSFDLDDNRIYCMTQEHFATWEKTHSKFSKANGDGLIEGVLKNEIYKDCKREI